MLQHTMALSYNRTSITAMLFSNLGSPLAPAMEHAAASAPPNAEQFTGEASKSSSGRFAPTRRRCIGRNPYVHHIKKALRRVEALDSIRRELPEGWTISTDNHQDGSEPALRVGAES